MKKPADTRFFTYYNANPKGRHVGDCVIRALSVTPGYDWYKAYDELCALGRELTCSPNWELVWDAWLKSHGYVQCKQPKRANGKLYMLREFVCSDLISDDDIAIVSISGHMTAIKGRKIQDIWDCAEYKVRRYYRYEGNNLHSSKET